MAESVAMPSLEEAMRWLGAPVTEIGGAAVGEVEALFVDSLSGKPAWLVARLGRRRGRRLVAAPLHDCAGAAVGVWIAQDGQTLQTAPVVDPTRPLRREHELTICSHFGIGENVGRAAEVVGRSVGDVTSEPVR